MSDLTKPEVVAMWLWGDEYAQSGMGAVEWWKRLDASRKRIVRDFMRQYDAAHPDGGPRP